MYGFTNSEEQYILKVVLENKKEFKTKWDGYFSK